MNGDVKLHFVPTEYQLAVLFTKLLDEKRFNQLISELGMLNPDNISYTTISAAKITALLENISARTEKEDPLKNLATSPWPSIFLSAQGDLMHPASHLQHRVLHLRGRKTCRIPSSKRDDSHLLPPPLAGYLLLIRDYSHMTKKVPFSPPTSSPYWPISTILQRTEPMSQVEIGYHLRGRKPASLLICRLCIIASTSCFLDMHLLRGRNISDQNLNLVMIAVVSFIRDRSIPIQDLYSTQE
ncbi:hypothetical protein OSB04_028081 [Centaurea solstitialis]|uniref:Uncharacterized protein n=1 Tax=Centaurea solstitialis TaxID=347529 RepID=A0AA38SF13_9ASTR|nr:hypothetical protein OSB04_028081 [Centaurea solstitialis]